MEIGVIQALSADAGEGPQRVVKRSSLKGGKADIESVRAGRPDPLTNNVLWAWGHIRQDDMKKLFVAAAFALM